MYFVKKVLIWIVIIGFAYAILGYHYVFYGTSPFVLKKEKLGLGYTMFHIPKDEFQMSNETIIDIDPLRRAGIGTVLVEIERITQKDLDRLLRPYSQEDQQRKK